MATSIAARTQHIVRRYDSVAYRVYCRILACSNAYLAHDECSNAIHYQTELYAMACLFFPFLPIEAMWTISAYEEEVHA